MSLDTDAAPPARVSSDVALSTELVQRLVEEQHPDLAGPVRMFSTGWDNLLFRLGDHHLARMPRRRVGAENLERERHCIPRLPNLPIATTTHLRSGTPSQGYPYAWAITPFLPGTPVGTNPIDPERAAKDIAAFLTALHRPCPASVPRDAARSLPLISRDQQVRGILETMPDSLCLLALWEQAVATPLWGGPDVWVHGDLHPFNMLADHGELTAVLDWGDVFGGAPCPDLAVAWMLLDPKHHEPIRARVDADTWTRGMGWAVYYAAVLDAACKDGAGAGFARVSEITARRLVL